MEERLKKAIREDRCPHAVLLTGPGGSGMPDRARRLAALYCLGREDVSLLENEPNFVEMDPDLYDAKTVRDMLAGLQLVGFNGGRRAVFLPEAERLSVICQNILLKTLEEPPEGVLFLLMGTENGLLPTIRSRCAVLRFGSMSQEEVLSELLRDGIDRDTAVLCARLSDNVYTAAKRFADPEYAELRKTGASILERTLFSAPPLTEAANLVKTKKKKGDAEETDDGEEGREDTASGKKEKGAGVQKAAFLIDVWTSLLRDGLLKGMGLGFTRNTDMEALTDRISKSFTTRTLNGMIIQCADARERFAYNANAGQTLDAALLGICRGGGKQEQKRW